MVKNALASAGDVGLILGWEGPLERETATHSQYSCLGNPMDRSLAGYSPSHHKQSDMTEHEGMHINVFAC